MINFKYLTIVIGKKERSFLMGWKLSEKKNDLKQKELLMFYEINVKIIIIYIWPYYNQRKNYVYKTLPLVLQKCEINCICSSILGDFSFK